MIILSILIPTFNYKKGLIQILDSLIICEKEYLEKIEIIISDDSESRLLDSNFINPILIISNIFIIRKELVADLIGIS